MGELRTLERERLIDNEPAQILHLALAQRSRQLRPQQAHGLPAAPAGGPAKDSAKRPIAVMSTSTSCGPPANKARSSAFANSSMSETRWWRRPNEADSSWKSGVCRSA